MGQENQGLGVPTLSIAAKPRLAVTLRKVLSPAQRVDQPHLIYGPALCLQKPWRSDNDREALRPRDRYVQPVAGVEELDLPGQVVTGRCSHRDQHNRRFLALELIHGADLSHLRQARPEKVDLHIIR